MFRHGVARVLFMQMDAFQRPRALARGLYGRATEESEEAVGDSFDICVAHSLDLIDYGEPAVALANLAQNVYEFHVPLARRSIWRSTRLGMR